MSEFMSVGEAAQSLELSERRVRALIADGKLPAQRLLGRWAVPAGAVAAHGRAPAGRPMSESSAWAVLEHLAAGAKLSSRLNYRVHALRADSDPLSRLLAWMSARGNLIQVWGFAPAIAALRDDERVVVSGDHVISDLEGSGPLRVYAAAADVDDLLSDHGLREAGSDKIANALIWVVDDLSVVPRSDADPHAAASAVAAVDLLDEGDPRAQAAAHTIIENLLRGIR